MITTEPRGMFTRGGATSGTFVSCKGCGLAVEGSCVHIPKQHIGETGEVLFLGPDYDVYHRNCWAKEGSNE